MALVKSANTRSDILALLSNGFPNGKPKRELLRKLGSAPVPNGARSHLHGRGQSHLLRLTVLRSFFITHQPSTRTGDASPVLCSFMYIKTALWGNLQKQGNLGILILAL